MGLKIDSKDIPDSFLAVEELVAVFLPLCPNIYKRLIDSYKGKEEYINIFINASADNIKFVANEYITDNLLFSIIRKLKSIKNEQVNVFVDFFNRVLDSDPNFVFETFLLIDNEDLLLLIMGVLYKRKVAVPLDVKQRMDEIINDYRDTYIEDFGIDIKYIQELIDKVINGEVNCYNLCFISNFKELLFVSNFGDIYCRPKFSLGIKALSYDTLTKSNLKHYKELKNKVLSFGIPEFIASIIALGMYTTLGYMRSRDLLDGKYGPVTREKLCRLFAYIDGSEVLFEEDNTKFRPILNEQFINLLFGENYKVENTPIKNFLNEFTTLRSKVNKDIEKVKHNGSLSESEKNEKIASLERGLKKYCENIRDFFDDIGTIYFGWDVIEEELLRKQKVSKLKVKLSIPQINEIFRSLGRARFTIRNNDIEKNRSLHHKIPFYEARDYPLAISDVFNYVGIDTQYTHDPVKAPHRAVELSRQMEGLHSKKFPNVDVVYGDYYLSVFNPQDRNLLSAGFRSGCCFRPNGTGDEYGINKSMLSYCAVTEYGGGLEIRDAKGRTLMFSPILRNGNVLMLHSFESLGLTFEEEEICNEMLFKWAEKVLEVSKEQEAEEAIVAVVMTDLHNRLDKSMCVGTLLDEKKFSIYNFDGSYSGMYTNLSDNNHCILRIADGKDINDIRYNFPVRKSYQYPDVISRVSEVKLDEQELEQIELIMENEASIIDLANEKSYLEEDGDVFAGFNLLRDIKEKKMRGLELRRELYSIHPDSNRDILADYLQGIKNIENICEECGSRNVADMLIFKHIIYAEGWYVGIAKDNRLVYNYLDGFQDEVYGVIDKFKKNYGDELTVCYGGDIIRSNGGNYR